jgi:hypothetical protein
MSGDSLFYSYPLRTIAWNMIRAGQLPLWTPGVLSGYPLLSMAQLGLGYPVTWGYLFLPPYLAEKIYVLTPFLLAPVFTYFYLRKLDRSAYASILGALAFGYGGMMASPLSHSGLVSNAFMWLPLLLLVIEKSRRARFIPSLIAATIVYSLSVLTGIAQTFQTVGILAAAYSVWLAIAVHSDDSVRKVSRWQPVFVTAGAGLLSIGVAAFQILETARVVRRSVRRTLSYEQFTQGSFTPNELWESFTTPIFHVIDMHTSVAPLAAALACVAVVAHLLRRNNQQDLRVFFWFIVAVVAIVLMLGPFTPVYRVLYYIPIVNLFRVPSRHTAEWTFAAGVLAAYGWDALAPTLRRLRQAGKRSNLSTLYPALALIGLGLLIGFLWWTKAQTLEERAPGWPHSPTTYRVLKDGMAIVLTLAIWRASLVINQRWRAGLLVSAILISCFVEPSLLIRRWWGNQGRPVSAVLQPSAVTRYLKQFPASGNRIYTRVGLMSEQEGYPLRLDATNLSAMWGLNDVAGYEPLTLERYSQALGGAVLDGVHTLDRGAPDNSLFSSKSHVLDLLNTTFVVSYRGLATSQNGPPTPHSEFWQQVFEQNDAVVMRNSRALPRAWLVGEAQAVRMEVALDRIRGDSGIDFDPRRTVLVEVGPSDIPPLPGGPLPPDSEARIVSYEPNRIVIQTKATQSSVLVVSELFFPGWEAWVDGKWTRIQIANYLLRGVFLPAGEHKVEMRYTAPAFRYGALISIGTLGLLTLLLFVDRRKQRLDKSRS